MDQSSEQQATIALAKLSLNLHRQNSQTNPTNIRLIATDENPENEDTGFFLDKEIAKESVMIKRMLEVSREQKAVQLPNLDRTELEVMINLMTVIHNARNSHIDPKRQLLEIVNKAKDVEHLSALLFAANFLAAV